MDIQLAKSISLPQSIWDKISPDEISNFIISHIDDILAKQSTTKDSSSTNKTNIDISLTSDQKKALKVMLSGRNCFITGGAGVGKSFLIREFVKQQSNVLLAAPTGIAAYNIGGVTLHSLFGIPVKNDIYTREDIENAYNSANDYTIGCNIKKDRIYKPLLKSDILIIDEISMCRGDLFELISAHLNGIQDGKYNKNIQLILVGDFFQLPPILTSTKNFEIIKNNGEKVKVSQIERYNETFGNTSGFAFLSDKWKFKKCVLKEILRQKDIDFAQALNAFRKGNISGYKYICSNSSNRPLEDAIWVCGKNIDADIRNKEKLDKIEGQEALFTMELNISFPDLISAKELQKEAFKIAKENLYLKVGCSVIALVNTYIANELLYSNGMRGIVKEIKPQEKTVIVEFENGKCVNVTPYTWEITKYCYNESNKHVESTVVATFSQIPLTLGYATTVHKSQGQTFSAINVDKNCNFACGQLYVALSRATNVENIYIERKNIIPLTSNEVRQFYFNKNTKKS